MTRISTALRGLFSFCVLAGLSFTVAAHTPAPAPAPAPATTTYSGFLKDYSDLKPYQDALGTTVMRSVNPKLTPQNYKAVMLDKVTLYPAPQPTDAVSAQTLADIAKHADTQLREVVGSQVKIVDTPGPGVARMRVAITGSSVEKEGLKPYQYIPIAFLLTAASRATSGAPHKAKIFTEAEITDSVTGERLLASVREGTGETFDGDKVTVDSLKPLLGKWMAGAANEVPKFIAPK